MDIYVYKSYMYSTLDLKLSGVSWSTGDDDPYNASTLVLNRNKYMIDEMVMNIAEDVCIFYLSQEWLTESTDPTEWGGEIINPGVELTPFAEMSYVYWPIRGLHVIDQVNIQWETIFIVC